MDSPEITSVVIENGSSETRAGFSTEQLPSVVFPSLYAKKGDSFVFGDELYEVPEEEVFTILNDGVVYNWDALEANWRFIYNQLGADPSEQPLVIAEELWNNKKNRSKLAEVAFEKLGVPAFAIIKAPMAVSYGVGRSTSIVIDIGSSTTSVTPIMEGTILYKGAVHSKYAGDYLNAHVHAFLTQATGTPVESYFTGSESHKRLRASERILTDIKAGVISVSTYPIPNAAVEFTVAPKHYELPNGERIDFGKEQVLLAEPLFLPANYPLPGAPPPQTQPLGLTDLILSSLKKLEANHEVYVSLLSNIVITGGGSLIEGIEQRVLSDLARFLPQYSIQSFATPVFVERKRSVWTGASILASMNSFESHYIAREEYRERGDDYLHEKFK